jgi:voltage-gated potassium channel
LNGEMIFGVGKQLYAMFLKIPLVGRMFFISLCIILFFGLIIHMIEPATFPTIFEGIWWAFVTASTVGFGDYAPKSTEGRMLGILLILIGASFLTYYFANIVATAISFQNDYLSGRRGFKGMGHIMIIGWNERSREIISALKQKSRSSRIVLVDETLERLPTALDNLHFIKGSSLNDAVLLKANAAQASTVIITADANKTELEADMHSILTLLAIKGINPSVFCIVEILTPEQVENAKRAGADKILQTYKLISSMILKNIDTQDTGMNGEF